MIHTELPFLLLKEFPSVQEHESCIKKSSTSCHRDTTTADAHRVKWNAMFDQMDKTLSEEERQLVSWPGEKHASYLFVLFLKEELAIFLQI